MVDSLSAHAAKMIAFGEDFYRRYLVDARTITRLALMLRVASKAAGLDPADVKPGPDSVGLIGTGVDVVWAPDVHGRGRGGWAVRHSFYSVTFSGDMRQQKGDMVTETVAVFVPDELIQAAARAVMSVVQRNIEAALGEVG